MKCKSCGGNHYKEDNFCQYCGKKLKDTCNCWVMKKDNYTCGERNCPGYKYKVKITKNQSVSESIHNRNQL